MMVPRQDAEAPLTLPMVVVMMAVVIFAMMMVVATMVVVVAPVMVRNDNHTVVVMMPATVMMVMVLHQGELAAPSAGTLKGPAGAALALTDRRQKPKIAATDSTLNIGAPLL